MEQLHEVLLGKAGKLSGFGKRELAGLEQVQGKCSVDAAVQQPLIERDCDDGGTTLLGDQ